MTLSSKPLAIMIVVILFGGIFFSSALGWWQTESTKQAATFQEGEFAGQPDPADIRGSYTFGDIENNFGVPAAVLAEAFRISTDDPSAFGVKDLESIYAGQELEIGTSSVRLFVALYTGLPYEVVEEVYLPQRAVEMLQSQARLSTEQIAYLETHAVAFEASGDVGSVPEEHTETETAERILKGKTTFQEVLDWGVPQETLERILGGAIPSPLTNVKDYCTEKGLSFEEIKPVIQAEIDRVE